MHLSSKKLLLIIVFNTSVLSGVTTFYASGLVGSSTLDVNDPTGTLVVLDVNLIISPTTPLVLSGNNGNLTFTATNNQQLIIASGFQWNISSLQKPHTLFFTGNAHVVMMPGAQIMADQVTGISISFKDTAQMSVVP